MKKLYWVICITTITALIFWGGYSFGKSSQISDILLADNIITDELIAATQNILLLEMLSEGEINKALSQLNARLDSQISIVNNFLPEDENFEGRIIADKIFLRIAKYRSKYPRKKTEDNFENGVDEILDELLRKTKQGTE